MLHNCEPGLSDKTMIKVCICHKYDVFISTPKASKKRHRTGTNYPININHLMEVV